MERGLIATLRELGARWEDRWLPASLRSEDASPTERRRARFLLWATTSCPPGVALAWCINRGVGREAGVPELAAELLVLPLAANLPLLRRGVPLARLSTFFAGTLTGIAFIPIVVSQGHALPATLLVTTFPAIAMVLMGMRAAFAWLGVVIAGLVGVAVLAELRPDLAIEIPRSVQERWLLAVPCLLTLIQTTLVVLLETSRSRAVEELDASRAALAESEMRFRAVFEAAPVGIGTFEVDGGALEANPHGRGMLGLAPGAPLDESTLVSCVHPDDRAKALRYVARALRGREDAPLELRWVTPDGPPEWVRAQAKAVVGADGAPHLVVGCAEFVTERKAAEERIRALAFFDGVTGLANRRLFLDRLARAIDVAERRHHPLAVLFLDLDGFKAVNDRHGHEVGDTVLALVAERFASSIRLSDQMGRRLPDDLEVSRYGGDEFTVLLAEVNGAKGAATVARRMALSLERPIEVGDVAVQIGVSIGIALYPDDGRTASALLRSADAAMYRAKREPGSAFSHQQRGTLETV